MIDFSRFTLLLVFGTCLAFAGSAAAVSVSITLTPDGTVGGTLVFRGDLAATGLTQVGAITIEDDGTAFGGADGIFSGFDLDAIFLDLDGSLATSADRIFGTTFLFSAGTTRPTANPSLLPNASHPGPTFGSLNASAIDFATATLNTLDGVSVADVNVADGFLTLGDGGTLSVSFVPTVPIGATLFLMAGEVGGQAGEGLSAFVTVSDAPIPEPTAPLLFGAGLLLVARALRRRTA